MSLKTSNFSALSVWRCAIMVQEPSDWVDSWVEWIKIGNFKKFAIPNKVDAPTELWFRWNIRHDKWKIDDFNDFRQIPMLDKEVGKWVQLHIAPRSQRDKEGSNLQIWQVSFYVLVCCLNFKIGFYFYFFNVSFCVLDYVFVCSCGMQFLLISYCII